MLGSRAIDLHASQQDQRSVAEIEQTRLQEKIIFAGKILQFVSYIAIFVM